jgi:hypothetical protein
MDSRVRYPRILAVLRTLVYLGATLGGVLLLVIAVSFLGLVTLLGLASLLLVGDVSELILLLVGGLGLVAFGSVGLLLVSLTRQVDRFLLRAARIPSPLEQVTARYVRGDIEEIELERGIERALITDAEVGGTTSRPDSPALRSLSEPAFRGYSLDIGEERG